MTRDLPPQDLQCPDPEGCTVAAAELEALAEAGKLPVVTIPNTRHRYRVYDSQDGFSHPNPGYGDTRFAPFDALETQERVPTLYLAESLAAALLETSFHDVHAQTPRVVSELSLHGKLHARLMPPCDVELTDLRDSQLSRLGFTRPQLASSSPEHYPCTRRVARAVHAAPQNSAGIIWHSRQAELSSAGPAEVAVVFADRVAHTRGAWKLGPYRDAYGSLLEGTGRLILDEVAETLNVTISQIDL